MEEQELKTTLPIVHRNDRELVQSYILTFARYNFDVYEKRIMYYIINDKRIQSYVREQIENLKNNTPMKSPFHGMTEYVISMKDIAMQKGEYQRYKEALVSLSDKSFQVENKEKKRWIKRSFVANPTIDLFEGYVSFYVHEDIIRIIAAIEHGYRQFDFHIAFRLKSTYSMRFYEMFSRQDKGENNGFFTKSISELKELFGLTEKYENNTMFIKRVIEPAKKELDELANFSFDYKTTKSIKSRKADEIQFHVYHIPENEKNDGLKENKMKATLSKYIKISPTLYEYLQEIGIEESGIISNLYTLYIIEQLYWRRVGAKVKGTALLISKIDELKERALRNDRDNWIGYVIGTLKKIEKIENEKDRAEKIALYNMQLEQEKQEQEPEQEQKP